MSSRHHKLPVSGPQREALRRKGQFWTPDWIAEAMVAYVLGGTATKMFDPAVGMGVFFRAAKIVGAELGKSITLSGTEIDPEIIAQARREWPADDFAEVTVADFVLGPPGESLQAIVANPPYIRHHRLSPDVKSRLKQFSTRLIGKPLDGRAGLHVYFLLRALERLDVDGRLAFIVPADICEGVFAKDLWRWITNRYCLDAVIAFSPDASPFPGVDTNPLIVLIRNTRSKPRFYWVRCTERYSQELKYWIMSDFHVNGTRTIQPFSRSISEGLITGLSRMPVDETMPNFVLGDFAKVLRGIATGANDFFFLTRSQADMLRIPSEFLIPAIGRTRDVTGDEIVGESLRMLDSKGRPTLLFSPDGRPIDEFPTSVQQYLQHGEQIGIHQRTLIATRNPWYKMETRVVPPILFAYLGRRNVRFIRNLAGVVPLTGFLCIYPQHADEDLIARLWQVLQSPKTMANLSLVGKSYGGDAIKVEPRALEQLPLPASALAEVGLQPIMKRLL